MSEHYLHKGRTEYVCLDKDAEVLQCEQAHTEGEGETLRGEEADTNGALMYHAVVACNARHGIPCPPYMHQKDLACVVCTK